MRRPASVLVAALAAAAASQAPAAAQQQGDPERCRSRPEHRQLDFWIGTWDVIRPDDGEQLGVNVIQPVEGLNDCALLESWTGARGVSGTSLNFYDPQRRTWRQVWVDGTGGVLDYREGELRDGSMHFRGITIGASGDTTLQQLIFTPVAPDTVRQTFRSSTDGGATWTTDWVGLYIRRGAVRSRNDVGGGVQADRHAPGADRPGEAAGARHRPGPRYLGGMAERRRVPTPAPWAETVGYSRAVRVGDTIYVSGTAPVGEKGEIVAPGDVYAQTRRCLDIIIAALGEAGARPEHVVRTRIYVRDAASWREVGRAHAEVLGHAKPATTLVEVSGFIDPAIEVEIEAVAVV